MSADVGTAELAQAVAESAEAVGSAAAALLAGLEPWDVRGHTVRSACASLTLALATLAVALDTFYRSQA